MYLYTNVVMHMGVRNKTDLLFFHIYSNSNFERVSQICVIKKWTNIQQNAMRSQWEYVFNWVIF